MIDPHVHLRDWAQAEKETLVHGMRVALLCGVDEVFDMPNTSPVLTTRDAIEKRLADAQASNVGVKYHLYAGLTTKAEQIKEVVQAYNEFYPRVVGMKFFAGHSTGNMGLIAEEEQKEVYRQLALLGYEGVVALHCEKESLLRPELEDPEDFSSHSLARPAKAESASVADQLTFSQEAHFKGHLHVCHISTLEALHLVEEAKKQGTRVSCGVTPHHVLLSSQDAKDHALYAKMNPPLRSESERSALYAALLEGRIDWIETDHAPHTLKDKENGASGIPGFSGLLLLLKRLIENGCPQTLLEQLLGGHVQEVFGLQKLAVSIPAYDDLLPLSERAAKAYPFDSFATIRNA